MQRISGVGMVRGTYNKCNMRVENVLSTEFDKVVLELHMKVLHQRVKRRGGESSWREGGDGRIIGWNLRGR